jgi:hypothetical protein
MLSLTPLCLTAWPAYKETPHWSAEGDISEPKRNLPEHMVRWQQVPLRMGPRKRDNQHPTTLAWQSEDAARTVGRDDGVWGKT